MTRDAAHAGPVGARTGVRRTVPALVVGVVVLLAGSALAAAPAAVAASPAITVFPEYGPPGTVIRVTGHGFCPPPCSTVSIDVGTEEVAIGVDVTGSGTFARNVQVPGGLPAGTTPVVARQQTASGSSVSGRSTFQVTPGVPAPTRLPPPTAGPPVQPRPGVPSTIPSTAQSTPRGGASASRSATTTSAPATATATTTSPPVATALPAADTSATGGGVSWWWGVLGLAVLAAVLVAIGVLVRRRAPG